MKFLLILSSANLYYIFIKEGFLFPIILYIVSQLLIVLKVTIILLKRSKIFSITIMLYYKGIHSVVGQFLSMKTSRKIYHTILLVFKLVWQFNYYTFNHKSDLYYRKIKIVVCGWKLINWNWNNNYSQDVCNFVLGLFICFPLGLILR